uniref:Uncharacterized protein n=1 Tax=Bionectria ochroleuca TaxID=29856 RepID=A0A8H7KEA5_BIOOC
MGTALQTQQGCISARRQQSPATPGRHTTSNDANCYEEHCFSELAPARLPPMGIAANLLPICVVNAPGPRLEINTHGPLPTLSLVGGVRASKTIRLHLFDPAVSLFLNE